jgi:protein involved in temperature-dependent protein secretion
MRPLSKLLRRIHTLLILLMLAGHRHARPMPLERMRRHALIHLLLLIGDLDLARKLHVVVCELADLDVVDARGFFFFRGAEAQRGDVFADEVEGAEDQACADEGVGAARKGVGELVAELDPVSV